MSARQRSAGAGGERWLVLSPHLDDAVYSVGGLLHDQSRAGREILVVTVCAGDPPEGLSSFALEVLRHMSLDPAEAMATRRAEDRAALGALHDSIALEHWPFPEATFRKSTTGGDLYRSRRVLFAEPNPLDTELPRELENRLRELGSFERVLAPLGVGGHVDHRLVRRAALAQFGRRTRLWEDFPYVVMKRRALWAVLGPPGTRSRRWEREDHRLTPAAAAAEVEAVLAYRSQVRPLFRNRRGVSRRLRRHRGRTPSLRLWLPRTVSAPGRRLEAS